MGPLHDLKLSFGKLISAAPHSVWTKAASAICLLFIIVYSLIPQTERVNSGFPGKIEHVLAYSVTGLLLGLSFRSEKGPLIAAWILSLMACLLEFLQHWAPGRHPRVSDAVFGAVAGVVGAALAAWLRRRARTT
jgi:VanZ family protein